MGVRLTDLPDALSDEGVEPVVVDGFPSRGPDFAGLPVLHLVHWTAGPRAGRVPSLGTVTFGRPDLPYNLCTVLQSREGGTLPDKAYCVSSGRAVHAGTGEWLGVESGNSNGTGNEIEWSGPGEAFPGNRYETTIKIAVAHIKLQQSSADYVCNHREYAKPAGRKIDTNLDGVRLRYDVDRELFLPAPQPAAQEDDDMNDPIEIVRGDKSGPWWATDGVTRQWINGREHAGILCLNRGAKAQVEPASMAAAELAKMEPFIWPQAAVDSIRLVGVKPS